ncbi:MAG: redoxin domain-containing protein [Planctomycetales bacterium]|nr:redoxin domain-containing protein [Planctomycetales bacterium]
MRYSVRQIRLGILFLCTSAGTFCTSTGMLFAQPTAEDALALKPMQADAEYDTPTGDEIAKCTIRSVNKGDESAWVVYSPNGELLRRFVDTNNDSKLDMWCYCKNGIEVYRDIDADYNGKADQYRWYGMAGIRWGLDKDEDGEIDAWNTISPEETSAEVVRAIQTNDATKFSRVLLTEAEIERFGFEADVQKELIQKVKKAGEEFLAFAKRQDLVSADSKWVDFSAVRPGVIPSSLMPTKTDVVVYENVLAVVETNGKLGEVNLGTLVKVDDGWRVIDLPSSSTAGYFFSSPRTTTAMISASSGSGETVANPEMQELVAALEKVDKSLTGATAPAEKTALQQQRIETLRKLAAASEGRDRDIWLQQMIDSISSGAQTGTLPDGVKLLDQIQIELAKAENRELAAQARFAYLSAEYALTLQEKDADFAKIQDKWLSDLAEFVKDFPTETPAADAMLQLAISEEFVGNDAKAKEWYSSIVKDFPNSTFAKKAAGAVQRLDSVGRSVSIKGTTLQGRRLDVAAFRGNYVIVQYVAEWCQQCTDDVDHLQKLQKKYPKAGIISVSLDNTRQEAADYVRTHRINWPVVHEEGGLDSSLGTEMGIFTLPLTILIDKNGTVMNRNTTIAELDAELAKRFK